MAKKKSSLTASPLRQTADSRFTLLNDIVFDKMQGLWIVAVVLWSHVVSEWVGYWAEIDRNPLLYTVVAFVITLYAAFRGYRLFRHAQDIQSGRRGGLAVGEYVEQLREKGYRVYHDIPGENGTINHVVVGTQGVFTIETRTAGKPATGDPIVLFDGETVAVGSGPGDHRPIAKARAQAEQLKLRLQEQTGQNFSVSPVLVYPGWFVRSQSGSEQSSVCVLDPKSLHKWMDQRVDVLPAEQVILAATALEKMIRRSTRWIDDAHRHRA